MHQRKLVIDLSQIEHVGTSFVFVQAGPRSIFGSVPVRGITEWPPQVVPGGQTKKTLRSRVRILGRPLCGETCSLRTRASHRAKYTPRPSPNKTNDIPTEHIEIVIDLSHIEHIEILLFFLILLTNQMS